jgi:hypothetical protein
MTQGEFDAQSRVPEVLCGSIIPFLIATLFVIARFYSRLILTRSWAQDDAWILVSWVRLLPSRLPAASRSLTPQVQLGCLIQTILNCLFTHYGTGRHMTVWKPEYTTPSLLLSYSVRAVYQVVLGTTKIAVLMLYMRVFADKKSRYIFWGMTAFVVLYTIPLLMMFLFQCRPISSYWDFSGGRTCIDTNLMMHTSAGFNIAVDVALVVVAVPRIRKSPFSYHIISHSTLTTSTQSRSNSP